MDLNMVKNNLKSDDYKFLNNNLFLKDNILILTLAGSISYGTSVANSDIDLRGVAVEEKRCILGLANFEQFEDENTDTVIYGLKKFIKLCLNANPNTLEILGTDDRFIVKLLPEGKILRENTDLFLSKRAIQSFGNYANAQLRRLKNALARNDNYPQEEKEEHILSSILGQLKQLQRTYNSFDDGNVNLYIDKSQKINLEREIFIDVNLKKYPLRDFKNIIADMTNVIKEYDKLNRRNKKKDESHLNKHFMHLIRILVTGTDILNGKGLNVYRAEERELFLKVRNGELKYEEIFKIVGEYEDLFNLAVEKTLLPDEPDIERVEQLMEKIYLAKLKEV